VAFTGIERQQVWPPPDPTEYSRGWTEPASPWTYNNDGPNPALMPSNSDSAQHLRTRKRDAAGFSAVPPYHPDYDESAQHEYGGGEVDYDYDDGERFAEYEKMRQRMPFVRRGSEGYEVRPIDREQLLAEYITDRAQEDGHYCRYVPEPPSEPESEGEGSREEGEEVGAEVEVESVERDDYDYDDDDEEPLATRVEKWRSGEVIS
jgi:palmitoyltransferase ZDHHC6